MVSCYFIWIQLTVQLPTSITQCFNSSCIYWRAGKAPLAHFQTPRAADIVCCSHEHPLQLANSQCLSSSNIYWQVKFDQSCVKCTPTRWETGIVLGRDCWPYAMPLRNARVLSKPEISEREGKIGESFSNNYQSWAVYCWLDVLWLKIRMSDCSSAFLQAGAVPERPAPTF